MDVLRAQRREYNDLYRAHQATTTQDAFKMDMMLSLLAAQQNQAPGPNPIYNRSRENYSTRGTQLDIDQGSARRSNANPKPAVSGHGLGFSGLEVDAMPSYDIPQPRHTGHPTHDVRQAQMASLFSGSRQNNNVYSTEGFRFRSPIQADQVQASVEPTYKTVADYEFAQRRRVPTVPGVCARQVLESPVDAWGLQAILLKIRASSAPELADHTLAAWNDAGSKSVSSPSTQLNTPVDGPVSSLDGATPTKANGNRLSIPSAASDESAPVYDYFHHDALELPLTPTTSAYSEHQQASNACIIRVSGADLNDADLSRLAQIIHLLVQRSPLVLRAAFAACEPLADGEPLGSFIPSDRDISVKLLFMPNTGVDNFTNASEIFHHLGGCILVKGLHDYVLDEGDEPFVQQPLQYAAPQHTHAPRRARQRRWRGLMQDGIVPPDVPMLGHIFEQRVRESAQPVDRFAMQLRNEYGVDVAALAR
ncbi:hypothetical protein EXIGLDRAFT_730111 [Exidia glandulosa HHB12029]|uniref:Uncharacterized protein n=1 Tax=Exidia glandulosa HHB12029 TaxID=1314781 RepID=A0A165ZFB0_EXIGL|nr:hypothetical protein EXIGLDRAFT_730111 [Exidia glandulosa HHB12029]